MPDKLTYTKDGCDIKTSKFLKNRGSCCKTSCLHCPYGFTLKKEGLEIKKVDPSNFQNALEIFKLRNIEETSVTSNLFGQAFGKPKTKENLNETNMEKYRLVALKGENCAIIKYFNLQATELYHAQYFDEQGITLDYINSIL